MGVFVDTSALLPVIHVDDDAHASASAAWAKLLKEEPDLVTTNYVVVEAISLAQSRFGMTAARTLSEEVLPALRIRWVDAGLHAIAEASLLGANRRRLSLVDCASFAVMHEMGLRTAFAFDKHFKERGFELVA